MSSILTCRLLRSSRSARIDEKRGGTYRHSWLVEADGDMAQLQVLVAAVSASPNPVPDIWTYYDMTGTYAGEYDLGSFLQGLEAVPLITEESNRYFWKITGDWKPKEEGQNEDEDTNPISRPPKFSLEWAQFTKKVTRDIVDDRLLANSAGDLYEIEKDDARPVLVAVKNMATLNSVIALSTTYKNAVNNATFYGAPAGSAKVESIVSGNLVTENAYTYYAVTIKIQFTNADESPDGWHLRLENKGNMAYDIPKSNPMAVKQRVIVTGGRRKGEFKDFAYLKYTGEQLPDDQDPLPMPAAGDDPYRIYYPRDFSGLGIGTS